MTYYRLAEAIGETTHLIAANCGVWLPAQRIPAHENLVGWGPRIVERRFDLDEAMLYSLADKQPCCHHGTLASARSCIYCERENG